MTVPFTMVAVRFANEGTNIFTLLMLQNLFSFLIILPFVLKRGFSELKSNRHKLLFIRTFCGFVGVMAFFYAVTKIPLNEATTIGFTNPIFTTLMAVIILREKLLNYKIIGLLIGFAGVLVVLQPEFDNFNHNFFYLIAGVFLLSIVQILIKILNRTETPFKLFFYMIVYSAVVNIPLGIYFWQTPPMASLIWIAVIGAMAFVNMYPLIVALKYADISDLMPLDFTKLIFTAIFAYFVFGEELKITTLIGSVVILSGVYFVVNKERKMKSEI